MISTDAIGDKYDTLIDRESAEEILQAKAGEASAAAAEAQADATADKEAAKREGMKTLIDDGWRGRLDATFETGRESR